MEPEAYLNTIIYLSADILALEEVFTNEHA